MTHQYTPIQVPRSRPWVLGCAKNPINETGLMQSLHPASGRCKVQARVRLMRSLGHKVPGSVCDWELAQMTWRVGMKMEMKNVADMK